MTGIALPEAEIPDSELRRRLAEAEDTLRAIREGEVDALVVRGQEQDEVFALGGHDSYRVLMEAMEIGAAAIDERGRVLYANGALCGLLQCDPSDVQGRELAETVDPKTAQVVKQLVTEAVSQRCSRQVSMACGAGLRHVQVTAAPLPLGFGSAHALTFADVTERVEAAAADEGERIGRAIMASSNEAVVVCNLSGVVTHANAGVRQIHDGRVVGQRFEEVFEIQFSLGSGLINGTDLIQAALAGSVVRGVEGTMHDRGSVRDILFSAAPLRQAGQAIGGCIVTFADVSDRKQAEKRQKLLVGELNHRVKNTLTLVLSIANRTIAGASNLCDFRLSFAQRLEALAATHNLLAEGAWRSLTLEELVAAELAPYVSFVSPRVASQGLDLRVEADMAVALGLIFHELVTNAVKYGALSNEAGTITITATRRDAAIEIVWQEDGGPKVSPPSKVGFGQSVISRGLGQRGDMATRVEFRANGLVCRMFLPSKPERGA